MFSLHLAETESRSIDNRSWPERMFGRLLGFCAGLVLVTAIDRLFLEHALWHGIGDGVARTVPLAVHAARGVWAGIAGG